jgi:hypothetical protein
MMKFFVLATLVFETIQESRSLLRKLEGRQHGTWCEDDADCYMHPSGPNCNTLGLCTQNGGWSSWAPFSACNKLCGGGVKTRKRSCNKPAPINGGDPCNGKATQDESCNTQDCESAFNGFDFGN